MIDPEMPADNSTTAEFEAVPDPTGHVEAPPRTGHPDVDAALERLEQAATLPPIEQIGAYDAALSTLQEALTTIDESP